MDQNKLAQFSPGRVILYSLLFAVFGGTGLLALPIAQKQAASLFDLLFTATSALCVTGLFTVPIETFTLFGHAVLLILMQIGGLGLITMTLLVIYLFTDLGFATKLKAGKILEIESWQNINALLRSAFLITMGVECIGTCAVLPYYISAMPFWHAIFYSFFHAVSSFCNVGILILPFDHAREFGQSYGMLSITIFLMFVGGFGFVTMYEIGYYCIKRWSKKRHNISLQTKIVVYGTAVLTMISMFGFWLLERNNSFADLSMPLTFLNALFYSISSQSAGMFYISLQQLQIVTIFLIIARATIGSSPSSTGSGVKITTFSLFLATIKTAITGRSAVEIFERRIDQTQVYKAIAIVSLSIGWMLISTFFLCITEKEIVKQSNGVFALIVESFTAFNTLGISFGITGSLTFLGKCIIMLNMIVGRVGSLTLVLALKLKKRQGDTSFSYPKEQVILS